MTRPAGFSPRCAAGFPRVLRVAVTVLLATVVAVSALPAQQTSGGSDPVPALLPGEYLDIVQRINYSRRTDGRYAGHVQRETRTRLLASEPGAWRGEFMTTENTIRDLRTIAVEVSQRLPVAYRLEGGGLVRRDGPSLWQGMPTVPTDAAAAGWDAPAMVRLQLPDGGIVTLPVMVAYRPAVGTEIYQGTRVRRIDFGYRLQWPLTMAALEEHPGRRLFADAELPAWDQEIRGSHQGSILMPVDGGVPLLHRTEIVESYRSPVAGQEERRGFMLTWYRSSEPQPDLLARLQERAVPGVTVDRDELERVRLSISDLQFVANEATLLPGERGRVNTIAQLLSSVPEYPILVTGHTADVGTAESQQVLSVARARTIAEALQAAGVAAGRIRYEGRGGREPVADNSSAEGRARNRRVEIRLLERP